ncbi:MAG: DegT/DnrJ/EryC1/StrS family aminotransferase, partial [Desulfobacterales bacterium]|nr:DegT/DnrJ/EryC1/StrS family aminotransferase [Desulfobacterales bacterium]
MGISDPKLNFFQIRINQSEFFSDCREFQQKKNLSLGEGGMVITDDAELEARLRDIYSFGSGVALSYNYRMPELQAAIGRARLPQLDADNEARGRHARFLDGELTGLACLRPQQGRADTGVVY